MIKLILSSVLITLISFFLVNCGGGFKTDSNNAINFESAIFGPDSTAYNQD